MTGATAATDIFHYPYTTTVDFHLANPSLVDTTHASGSVDHELMHGIGGGDSNAYGGCATANSIMREADGYNAVVTDVQPADVAAVNTNFNQPSNCGYSKNNPNLQDSQDEDTDGD